MKKIQLIPSLRCEFLGFIYDLVKMHVELPNEKRIRVLDKITKIKLDQLIVIRDFAKILVFLVSCCAAVKYGWVYTKSCEREKFLALRKNQDNYDGKMRITASIIEELRWWKNLRGVPFNPIKGDTYSLEIYSDASLTGWGAFCMGKRAHGHWKENERENSINFLELAAAFFGLKIFAKNLKNCQILLHIDNSTAIAYINRMGGVQFNKLNKITKSIWQWCEERDIWIYAKYIASEDNIEADFESRREKSNIEIALKLSCFQKICRKYGKPDIDLFASRSNAKCKQYISWKKDPESVAVDAFTISWKNYFFYAFPPFSMILKTISKIKRENARGIIIVPEWPGQPWYPLFKAMLISEPIKFNANDSLIFSSNQEETFWNKTSLVAGVLSA